MRYLILRAKICGLCYTRDGETIKLASFYYRDKNGEVWDVCEECKSLVEVQGYELYQLSELYPLEVEE